MNIKDIPTLYTDTQPPAGRNYAMAYRSIGSKPSGTDRPSEGSGRLWDDLRREARRLEGDLDARLAAYGRMASGFERGEGSGLGADALAATKSAEIEGLLQRLADVNDDMSGATSGASDSRAHILARHRDILAELTAEYRRLKAAASAARDRASLLGPIGSETSPLLGVQVHTPSTIALRERSSLATSSSAADEALATAANISAGLVAQRRMLESSFDKLLNGLEKIPAIGGILTNIRRKKSRDSMVLAAVIAGCTFLMIIYFWSR